MEQVAAEPLHAPESARLPEPVRVAAPGTAAQEPALLSANADASVASSFQALAESVVLQDSAILGDAVREMLRPMLKQWLDDNLPVLVERLVRAEIERVARGGR
jgi:cell pole-organizing protein PopZ